MKRFLFARLPLGLSTLIFVGACMSAASAQNGTFTNNYGVNVSIPDNDPAGVTNTQNVSTVITSISLVRLTLQITGTPNSGNAFNGDFYATLTHGSNVAVLLNRTGRTATNSSGYGDSGFSITFDDQSLNSDIHLYRNATNPNGGMLTGTWGSDGRNINPAFSLDTTPRTALLTTFAGMNPNGNWSLLIADASPAGTGRFVSWQLEITGAIPEPQTFSLLAVGGAAVLFVLRRKRCTSV